jgi:hypothetical protein
LYDNNGVLTDATKLEPVQVFHSNLRFAWGQTGIGMDIIPVSPANPADPRKPKVMPPGKQPTDATKPAAGDGKH